MRGVCLVHIDHRSLIKRRQSYFASRHQTQRLVRDGIHLGGVRCEGSGVRCERDGIHLGRRAARLKPA
jgi:hypothetical protein